MSDIKRTTLEEFLEQTDTQIDLTEATEDSENDSTSEPLDGEHLPNEDKENPDASNTQLTLNGNTLPTSLTLLPVRERPFFPGQILPVIISKSLWGSTFQEVQDKQSQYIGIIYVNQSSKNTEDEQQAAKQETLKVEDFAQTGTLVRIQNLKIKSDYIQLIAEGVRRFQIVEWQQTTPPFKANVIYPKDKQQASEQTLKAYAIAIMNAFKELLPLNPFYSEELKYFLSRFNLNNAAQLADFAAALTTADNDKLQEILDTLDLDERLEKVLTLLKDEIDLTKIQSNIREKVEENISEQQREFFLRQQLKEIQSELGMTKDERTADIDLFKERLSHLSLTEEAKKKTEEELQKLSLLDPHSSEYGVSRNWLDWITQLPWGQYSQDKLDLKRARKILNKGHDGLEDVKDRILEFLAVGKLKGEVSGSIICLVGPPGVGKTSIGKSIAETLGRKFYRFSVGGMRDEAEIKGHRRTYIGALPGKFIQALKDCGTSNPVIMLDEIDKIGNSFHGDPASALLEVLDPEQNSEFMDHYLDVRFNLSKALFICTANTLDTIPSPLLDRMEVIRLSGYITEEKVQIAKHHLWPSLLKEMGLNRTQIQITVPAIRHIIEGYAREAGVRNLKKKLAQVIRKVAMQLVSEDPETPITIHVNDLENYLGQPRFTPEKMTLQIGTVTGLAWTAMGGATLTIEASRIHTLNRGFKLSGQLGEIMQESAGIAYSFITSNLNHYKADPEFFDKAFVHLHVPDGATPKDGPSAGITMATALLSLARGEPIKTPLAMTGELSLTGQVLPVGGIREKVIAAKRIGIKTLILPDENRKDFNELPDYLKADLNVHFAKHFDEVARLTFPIRAKSPALKHYEQMLQNKANTLENEL